MAKAKKPRVGSGPISQEGRNTAYPELCRKCAVRDGGAVHDRCDFCVDLAFDESTLCDLTRSVQDCDKFGCYAFRPVSRPRLSPIKSAEDLPDDQKPWTSTFADDALLSSDRFKYRYALAVQGVRNDPDSVNVDLKYHLAWNVARRKSVFSLSADAHRLIDNAFSACGEQIGGNASVLWLAPDHVHVYVESDGEKSIETIMKVLKRVSSQALRASNVSSSGKGRIKWEKAYFAQTIG
ncbi:MAG: transposase [Syntrophorhabdales bacterium]|jgi:REP element-mobilizing transposase RayT